VDRRERTDGREAAREGRGRKTDPRRACGANVLSAGNRARRGTHQSTFPCNSARFSRYCCMDAFMDVFIVDAVTLAIAWMVAIVAEFLARASSGQQISR
jgi:hypothetical protein